MLMDARKQALISTKNNGFREVGYCPIQHEFFDKLADIPPRNAGELSPAISRL